MFNATVIQILDAVATAKGDLSWWVSYHGHDATAENSAVHLTTFDGHSTASMPLPGRASR